MNEGAHTTADSQSDRVATAAATAEERPELLVAGAFVGGLLLAMLLKRVAGD